MVQMSIPPVQKWGKPCTWEWHRGQMVQRAARTELKTQAEK